MPLFTCEKYPFSILDNDNCDKRNLHIHKIVRGTSENQYETFQYVLPEQCNCPQLKTGEFEIYFYYFITL